MACLECKFTVPRRQAMMDVYTEEITEHFDFIRHRTGERVPVLVWPMPNEHGYFIVEHTDGRCEDVPAGYLTFLDSKELFDQYDWSDE